MGINRNIVECKSVTISGCFAIVSVLIETLWNVNDEDLPYYTLAV